MLLQFNFEYVSENDFFEYLLRFYAKNLNYELAKSSSTLTLTLQGTENEISAFCNELETLPNSVFLRDFSVKTPDNKSIQPQKVDKKFAKKDFLTSLNLTAYQQNSELKDNEWGEFASDELSFEGKSFQKLTKANFSALLDECVAGLTSAQSIFVKNECGIYKVRLMNEAWNADFAMATDIKAIKNAFVCTNENLKLLASLEKPLVKLHFSAPFRKANALNVSEFKLKLPHNLFFFALGTRLFKDNVNFLAFTKSENLGDEFEVMECEKRLIVLRGLDFINQKARELILSKDDKNMARISYILSRFDEDALLLELSQHYDDMLLVDKGTNLLGLSVPRNATQLYEELCADETGQRLYGNYKQKFALLEGEFEVKNNFFSLLGLLGQMLNLDKNTQNAAKKLLALSDSARLVRGVRIDFRLKEKSKKFDTMRMLRSVMSFLLAGVEAQNIAYGAVESLAFFLRDFYDELCAKNIARRAIISGSLFECKSLTKNTLKHLKNCVVCDVPLWL